MLRPRFQPDLGKQAGRQFSIGVVDHGTDAHRARPAIGGVGQEINTAVARVCLVRGQCHHDLGALRPTRAGAGTAGGERAQIGAFINIEIDVQRIDGNDGRQGRHAAGDIVALGDENLADSSADRRRDARETEFQLRGVKRGPGGVDLCLASMQRRRRHVETVARDNLRGK
ncbi:hypothetical protein D3C81_712380 [compost metagenome]